MSVQALVDLLQVDPEAAERFKAASNRAEGAAIAAEFGIELPSDEEAKEQLHALMSGVVGGAKNTQDALGTFADIVGLMAFAFI